MLFKLKNGPFRKSSLCSAHLNNRIYVPQNVVNIYAGKGKAAKKTMRWTDSLLGIPDNISISFLQGSSSHPQRILDKALNYYTQGYIHDIRIATTERDVTGPSTSSSNSVHVRGRCWRSMRKNESPHTVFLDIGREKVSDAHCSCKAG